VSATSVTTIESMSVRMPERAYACGNPRTSLDICRYGYWLNGHALKPIHDWVKSYEASWEERFEELDGVLEDLKRRKKGNDDDQS